MHYIKALFESKNKYYNCSCLHFDLTEEKLHKTSVMKV